MKKKQEGKYYNVKLLYQKGDCSYPRYQHYEEKTGKYR
jgi:hypothetical protein